MKVVSGPAEQGVLRTFIVIDMQSHTVRPEDANEIIDDTACLDDLESTPSEDDTAHQRTDLDPFLLVLSATQGNVQPIRVGADMREAVEHVDTPEAVVPGDALDPFDSRVVIEVVGGGRIESDERDHRTIGPEPPQTEPAEAIRGEVGPGLGREKREGHDLRATGYCLSIHSQNTFRKGE